jgi:hypothetical protein
LSPERLQIDIENRRTQENILKKKKGVAVDGPSDKLRVEGLKRNKRRMKLKAKGNGNAIIEKFSAQSSKSAKFAKKTTLKKKETGEEVKEEI